MAAIRPRLRANSATSYAVTWRLGATRDGAWQCETFPDKGNARNFKTDVEDAGGQWPEGWGKGSATSASRTSRPRSTPPAACPRRSPPASPSRGPVEQRL